MLRGDHPTSVRVRAICLLALLGALSAALVALGNPGNMGLCGACFLRDIGGALRLHGGPAILRPEVPGIVLGALLLSLATRRHVGRSGSYAVARFFLCVAMGIGAMVFLGCPFRVLQRLGGGDLNALLALPGLLLGVFLATRSEGRGYTLGKTSEVPLAVGLLGPALFLVVLSMFVFGTVLAGPEHGAATGPAHAPWQLALGGGLGAGAVLSATGFCAISACRQVLARRGPMRFAALAFVLAYAATSAATGNLRVGFDGQPIAHGHWLWNNLALVLVGLCGTFAGGCPVRQLVMTGEGNGDAMVGVVGLVLGGSLAHGLKLAATPATADDLGGPSAGGKIAVVVLLVAVTLYGIAMQPRAGRDPASC